MKKLPGSLIVTLSFILVLFPACETDFDVTAEWEDVTVVYGLLSQNDTTHYIKVSKAFLGEGNALQMAQEFDSIYYDSILSVTVEEWDQNEVNKLYTFSLDRVITDNKEPGTFSFPEQVLYTFDATLDQDHIYKLVIHNEKRDKLITAKTPMVHNFSFEKPILYPPAQPILDFPNNDYTKEVLWRSGRNGKRYEVAINFHYREQFVGEPEHDTFVSWAGFPTKKADIVSGPNWQSEQMKFTIVNKSFYSFLQERIIYDDLGVESNIAGRYADSVQFIFSVAADEFNTYLEINNASSLIDERPQYSNIENGIGLFSSRYRQKHTYFLHPSTKALLYDEFEELKFIEE